MDERQPSDRDQLSHQLRELRGGAGLSTPRVAALLTASGYPVSQAKVSRTENGRVAADPEYVARLAQLCSADPDRQQALVDLAHQVRKANRRLVLGRDEAAAQQRIGRFSREATTIRAFTPTAVPGELQTERYIRAIFDSDAGVRQRLLNQAQLDDPASTRRWVMLMTEGALGWSFLDASGMVEQIDHIAAATDRPNIKVGIIPWGRHTPVLPLHSWYLFDDRLVVSGGATFALDLTDKQDCAAYSTLTDELENLAVYGPEARAILAKAAQRYRSLS
jgi:hypothetical protein